LHQFIHFCRGGDFAGFGWFIALLIEEWNLTNEFSIEQVS
jgi:hypothetical protein